nr:zinc finger, RanBP2-type [Tanacetum cinerariifolium]
MMASIDEDDVGSGVSSSGQNKSTVIQVETKYLIQKVKQLKKNDLLDMLLPHIPKVREVVIIGVLGVIYQNMIGVKVGWVSRRCINDMYYQDSSEPPPRYGRDYRDHMIIGVLPLHLEFREAVIIGVLGVIHQNMIGVKTKSFSMMASIDEDDVRSGVSSSGQNKSTVIRVETKYLIQKVKQPKKNDLLDMLLPHIPKFREAVIIGVLGVIHQNMIGVKVGWVSRRYINDMYYQDSSEPPPRCGRDYRDHMIIGYSQSNTQEAAVAPPLPLNPKNMMTGYDAAMMLQAVDGATLQLNDDDDDDDEEEEGRQTYEHVSSNDDIYDAAMMLQAVDGAILQLNDDDDDEEEEGRQTYEHVSSNDDM